jgi:hypothetical protein
MKVVINGCFGGFSISTECVEECARNGLDVSAHCDDERTNPILVAAVEKLGERANGRYAALRVVEIPFDTTDGWHIDEYDGIERVAANHETWG